MGTESSDAVDAAATVLSDRRRRYVLQYLRESVDGTAQLSELAAHLIERCSDAHDPGREAIRLHHRILPSLVERGVLEYDSRSEYVRYRPEEVVDDFLECLDERAEFYGR